jgi:hypothetical protein
LYVRERKAEHIALRFGHFFSECTFDRRHGVRLVIAENHRAREIGSKQPQ